MKELIISRASDGQKIERILERYLPSAPMSFLYRMMRKKNITINGKKLHPYDRVHTDDVIRIWFSEETLSKFTGTDSSGDPPGAGEGEKSAAQPELPEPDEAFRARIIYENEHILLFNKPSGMLVQKADPGDISLNEYLISYLLRTKQTTPEQLRILRPSVCNRLDRNTSGIVSAGKTQKGLEVLSEMFRDRSIHKDYLCLAAGRIEEYMVLQASYSKDHARNTVSIKNTGKQSPKEKGIITQITPVRIWTDFAGRDVTLLEVRLITGRPHQIRAHLSAIGHPLIGDPKYGDNKINTDYRRKYGITDQLLHAFRLTFPLSVPEEMNDLSGRVFTAALPAPFQNLLENEGAETGPVIREQAGS